MIAKSDHWRIIFLKATTLARLLTSLRAHIMAWGGLRTLGPVRIPLARLMTRLVTGVLTRFRPGVGARLCTALAARGRRIRMNKGFGR